MRTIAGADGGLSHRPSLTRSARATHLGVLNRWSGADPVIMFASQVDAACVTSTPSQTIPVWAASGARRVCQPAPASPSPPIRAAGSQEPGSSNKEPPKNEAKGFHHSARDRDEWPAQSPAPATEHRREQEKRGRNSETTWPPSSCLPMPVQSCEGETLGWRDQRRCATEERREGAGTGTEDCGRDARQTQQRARDITFGLLWLWRWRRYVHPARRGITMGNDGQEA